MKMYETSQSVEKYLNVPLECSCGRTHFAPIKAVKIGKGALNSLPGNDRFRVLGHANQQGALGLAGRDQVHQLLGVAALADQNKNVLPLQNA